MWIISERTKSTTHNPPMEAPIPRLNFEYLIFQCSVSLDTFYSSTVTFIINGISKICARMVISRCIFIAYGRLRSAAFHSKKFLNVIEISYLRSFVLIFGLIGRLILGIVSISYQVWFRRGWTCHGSLGLQGIAGWATHLEFTCPSHCLAELLMVGRYTVPSQYFTA